MGKKLFWGLLLLGAALSLFLSTLTFAASLPKYGGVLHLSLLTEPTSLDPLKILLPADQKLCRLLYDTLVVEDSEGNISPHLAKSWETSPDGLVWTFTLREGLTFHDGQKIASNDVVFTLKRALYKGAASRIFPLLGQVVGSEKFIENPQIELPGIMAVGESAVQITLKKLDYTFLEKLASPFLAIVPAVGLIEKGDDFFLAPTGSGPFMFTSWERQRRIVLAANENYLFGRPFVDQIEYSVNSDPAAGILKLELQELDVYDIPSLDYQRFRDNRIWRDNVLESQDLEVFFVGINCTKPPFTNPQSRKALNYAIDRQSIIDILLAGQGKKATGILPAGIRNAISEPKSFPYDPEFAQKLLFSSMSQEDARQEVIFWVPNSPSEIVRIAERIQVNLLDAGINVFLQEKSWAEIYRALQKEALGEKPHLFLLSYRAQNDDPWEFLANLFASNGASNMFNYRSDKVDDLLRMAKQATSLGERFGMLSQVETIVIDEAPGNFLYFTNRKVIFQPKVMNIKLNLSQLNLTELWLRQ